MIPEFQLNQFINACISSGKTRYTELCRGISIDTWENYNPAQKQSYIKTHPNTQYNEEIIIDQCEDFEPYMIKGFGLLLNDSYILTTYKENKIYEVKSLLKDAVYYKNKENKEKALELLQMAQISCDVIEPYDYTKTVSYRGFKAFKNRMGFYILILESFEL